MSDRRVKFAVGAAGILAAFAALGPLSAYADGQEAAAHRDLAAARAATAKYHDEAKAVADGYQRADFCVESPDGVMGYHYVKPELLDAPMDVRTPPILLYLPDRAGGRKLAGVEYMKVDADQDLATYDDRPSAFNTQFDGPMPGHEPGMPVHYDLHVWLWKHNPDGMFAQFNPAVSC